MSVWDLSDFLTAAAEASAALAKLLDDYIADAFEVDSQGAHRLASAMSDLYLRAAAPAILAATAAKEHIDLAIKDFNLRGATLHLCDEFPRAAMMGDGGLEKAAARVVDDWLAAVVTASSSSSAAAALSALTRDPAKLAIE